jgi:hypothetical protein
MNHYCDMQIQAITVGETPGCMASKPLVSKFLHRLKQKKKIKIQQLKYTVIVFDPKYPYEIGIQFDTIEWYTGSYI